MAPPRLPQTQKEHPWHIPSDPLGKGSFARESYVYGLDDPREIAKSRSGPAPGREKRLKTGKGKSAAQRALHARTLEEVQARVEMSGAFSSRDC
jgi:hypothetical protein